MALIELAGKEVSTRFEKKLGGESFGKLCNWFEELRLEDHSCAYEASRNLGTLLSVMEPAAVGRWILAGLRLYGNDIQGMRKYFSLRDRRAIEVMHAEAGDRELVESVTTLEALYLALSGVSLSIQPRSITILNGPPVRPVITKNELLLPDTYTRLDGPDRFSVYKAALAHALAHKRYSTAGSPIGALKPMSIAVISLIEDARVEALLCQDYPGFRNLFLRLFRYGLGEPSLSFSSLALRLSYAIQEPTYHDDNYWVQKGRRLFQEAAAVDLRDYDRFRSIGSVLANDLGQMRVRFNPQQYWVQPAYRDDNSYLWDYGDDQQPPPEEQSLELDQGVDITAVSVGLAKEVDQADEERLANQIQEVSYSYPEWDYRVAFSRSNWCTVIERSIPLPPGREQAQRAEGRSKKNNAPLTYRLSRAKRLRKQMEGEDLDLNAVIEVQVDRRAGLAPEPRLFMRPGYDAMSSSILILVDLSESANDITSGGKTVLAIEKAAALYVADSAAGKEARLAIHGFSSNTRHEVNYFRFVDFDDDLDGFRRGLIENARAKFSTRMGAAIRHARYCLSTERSDLKTIVLVTDGAPSDVDVHDSAYLLEDARVAVQECASSGVKAFCLTVDRDASAYVKTIFGSRNFQIVDDPSVLSSRLYKVFLRSSLRG